MTAVINVAEGIKLQLDLRYTRDSILKLSSCGHYSTETAQKLPAVDRCVGDTFPYMTTSRSPKRYLTTLLFPTELIGVQRVCLVPLSG